MTLATSWYSATNIRTVVIVCDAVKTGDEHGEDHDANIDDELFHTTQKMPTNAQTQ